MRTDRRVRPYATVLAAGWCVVVALGVRAGSVSYTYDQQGRLRTATFSDASSVTYTLDAAGNRISTHLAGPDAIAPNPPLSVSATVQGYSQVTLSWSSAADNSGGSGIGGYYVYRGGTQIASTPATSYTDTNVKGSTTYSYSVASYDVAGHVSSATGAPSVTTTAAPPPSIPASLQASAPAYNQAVLSWGASTENAWGPGLAGYKIYRGPSSGSLSLYQTTTGTAFTYTDSGLSANTTYWYAVASYDALNATSAQSSLVSVTTPAGYIDTLTMTEGYYLQTIFGGQYYGFSPNAGSISPTTLTGGATVQFFYDLTAPNGLQQSTLQVSGFSADPGQTWLASATALGVTKTATSATYNYGAGTAEWTWTSLFGFASSGTTSVTITHR